jgi:CheY-like chemotaxis protein
MIHSKMILLIDDDTEDQEIFVDALRHIDSSVLCLGFTDGEEALRLLETEIVGVPDVIFLDLNMPRITGKQCLTAIKGIAKLNEVPIVIYTTSADKKDREEALALGADHFLVKPSRFEDLKDRLLDIFFLNTRKK